MRSISKYIVKRSEEEDAGAVYVCDLDVCAQTQINGNDNSFGIGSFYYLAKTNIFFRRDIRVQGPPYDMTNGRFFIMYCAKLRTLRYRDLMFTVPCSGTCMLTCKGVVLLAYNLNLE